MQKKDRFIETARYGKWFWCKKLKHQKFNYKIINLFVFVCRVLEILLKQVEFALSITVKITESLSLLLISLISLEFLSTVLTVNSQELSIH